MASLGYKTSASGCSDSRVKINMQCLTQLVGFTTRQVPDMLHQGQALWESLSWPKLLHQDPAISLCLWAAQGTDELTGRLTRRASSYQHHHCAQRATQQAPPAAQPSSSYSSRYPLPAAHFLQPLQVTHCSGRCTPGPMCTCKHLPPSRLEQGVVCPPAVNYTLPPAVKFL